MSEFTFVKMSFLKNTAYFGRLVSSCGIYPLSWQSLHFSDEVVVDGVKRKNGFINLMVRMNGSEYFTDISESEYSEIIENQITK